MSPASTLRAPRPSSQNAPALVRRSVFGLDVETDLPLEAVEALPRGGPATTVEVVTADALARAWRPAEAALVMERRYPSGRLVLSIHRHQTLGYRVSAPGHGRHVVASDGSRVLSVLPPVAPWRWQRLLFAQVLPLASTLRGFELFHASAVALRGRAVSFVAASGTGKTSVAAHLIARGASFVTDDVMAIETGPAEPRVYPGPAMVSVHSSELRAMTPEGRTRLGRALGRSGKVYVALEPVAQPLPLAAVFYLERNGGVESFSIAEIQPPDPQLLLSSSFIWYLQTPEHLLNHLDACARIARSVRLFRVRIPRGVPAAKVAELVEEHVLTVVP